MPATDESAQLFAARLLKPARQGQLFDTLLRCVAPTAGDAARPAPAALDERKNITVLVADDNAVNLKVACAILAKLGYDIRTATDGRQAVEAVAQAGAAGVRLGRDPDGREHAGRRRPGGHAPDPRRLGRERAADHRADGRRLDRRPRALRGRRHGRLPDQAAATGGAGAGAGALDRAVLPPAATQRRPRQLRQAKATPNRS